MLLPTIRPLHHPPTDSFFLRRRSDFVTLATETQKEEDSVALNKKSSNIMEELMGEMKLSERWWKKTLVTVHEILVG